MGFPSGVPGIPDSIFLPENFVFPVFDYDWGPDYDHFEASGVPGNAPPPILHVIKMMVPRVDADGNELGGVPTVQRDAPLGTYLGWNITASGFHTGQVCNYVGAYEKLRGKAYGEVDPRDPQNAVIADIELAPRNARGKVEYSMDFFILKPVNLRDGNRKLFVEVNNRGGKLSGPFNGSGGGNNPTTAADAGDAFLMNQGYSMAWNGWDPSASAGADGTGLTISVPV